MSQINVKIVGGRFTPKAPGLLTVDPNGTVPSIAEEIGKLLNKPLSAFEKCKTFAVIKGKKQDLPFAPSDTFSGRGMSDGDILFYQFPRPPDAATSPAKSVSTNEKSPATKGPVKIPPSKQISPKKSPPSPEIDASKEESSTPPPLADTSKKAVTRSKMPSPPRGKKMSHVKSTETSPSPDKAPAVDNVKKDKKRDSSDSSESSRGVPDKDDKLSARDVENTNMKLGDSDDLSGGKSNINDGDSLKKEGVSLVNDTKVENEGKRSKVSKDQNESSNMRRDSKSKETKSYDDINEIIEKTINQKMDQLAVQTEKLDLKSRGDIQRQVSESVERELKAVTTHMTALWESQKEQALKAQEEFEAKRLANLSQIVEKEAQLQESQVKFIEGLQTRKIQEDKNDAQLEEFFRANKELREELQRRREFTDNKIDELKDVQSSSSLMNHDTRIDNMLIIQNQIGRCLKSFNSLPTLYFPGGSPRGEIGTEGFISLGLFLSNLGLEKYEQTLRDHDVTVSELLQMNEWDLKDVGIDTIGARMRILSEIERRRQVHNEMDTVGNCAPGRFRDLTFSSTSEHICNYQPLTVIYRIVLQNFFRRYNPSMCNRIEEMIRIFGDRMGDFCAAMVYRHRVRATAYRPLLVKYLSHKLHCILPAVDLIASGFEGREAEFGEMLEEIRLGLALEQLHLCWVEVAPTKSYPKSYYHNTMCGLSQTKIPKVLENTTTKPIRKPTYSVQYPSTDQDFPHVNKSGREIKTSALLNSQQYSDNPSCEDDTRSYDRFYIAVIAAHLYEHNIGAMQGFSALVKEHRGRELDWLISLRDLQK